MGLTAEQQARLDALEAADAAESGQSADPRGEKVGTWRFPAEGAAPADTQKGGQIAVGDQSGVPILGAGGAQPAPAPATQSPPAPAGLTPQQQARLDALEAADAAEAKATTPKEDGMLARAFEKVWPTKEEKDGGVINPELEKYPDWMTAPEVHDPTSPAAYKAILGNIASLGPDDVKAILHEQFPDAKVEKRGEYVTAQFKPDGPIYASKPGLRKSDFVRAGLGVPATVAAALAAPEMLPAFVPAALSALAGTGLGVHILGMMRHEAGGTAPSATEDAIGMGAHVALAPVTALAGKALQTGFNAIRGIAPEAAGAMTAEQLAPEIVAAARNDTGAQARVAGQVMPDQGAVAAARSLPGVDGRPLADSLTPAQLSTNKVFQELAQSAPNAARTHIKAIGALGETLDKITKQAGAIESQAGVETALKNETKGQLDAAKHLMEDLYAKLDGREAVAANPERGIVAKPAVTAMVPGSAPNPTPNFDAAFRDVSEKGVAPDWVQKVRTALEKPSKVSGDLGPPVRSTVQRIKTLVGEATQGSGPFAKLGKATAKKLYNALVLDVEAGAENFSPGAKALSQEAKAAYLAHDAMDQMVATTMGKELEKSLTDQMARAVGELPHTDGKVFDKLIKATPEQMRPGLVKWALRQFIKENAEGGSLLEIRKFNSWMNSMKDSPPSWRALKAYAGDELADNLEKTYKVSRSVETASKRFAPDFTSTFPDELTTSEKAKAGAKYALKALVLDNFPIKIPDFVGYNIMGSVFDPRTPLKSAVEDFLSSPAGRMAIESQLKGSVSDGFIRNMMESGPAKRMLDAMKVPVSQRQAWWQRAFNSASSGSPATAHARATGAPNDSDLVKVAQ